jgi:hypothetical protein
VAPVSYHSTNDSIVIRLPSETAALCQMVTTPPTGPFELDTKNKENCNVSNISVVEITQKMI